MCLYFRFKGHPEADGDWPPANGDATPAPGSQYDRAAPVSLQLPDRHQDGATQGSRGSVSDVGPGASSDTSGTDDVGERRRQEARRSPDAAAVGRWHGTDGGEVTATPRPAHQ